MRILFICGSFEPGRDGVGDYLRQLCLELMRNGIEVAVAAIYDRHVTGDRELMLAGGAAQVAALRIPATLTADKKAELLKAYVAEFNPEWMSLQYVCFSFHDKGLNFGLTSILSEAGKGRKWEMMFHEIAVGMYVGTSFKELIWGKVQQYLAKDLMKKLKPVVHTNNQVYQKQLEAYGVKVSLLPLFSNIPVIDPERVRQKLKRVRGKHEGFSIVIFGSIYPGAPVEAFAREVKVYEEQYAVETRLTIIGRSGKEQERWVSVWKAAGLTVELLGEQNAQKVSEILTDAEFGVFTTPLAVVEKSGSVAAMREHGVHLIAVSREWKPQGIREMENLYGIKGFNGEPLDPFFNDEKDFSYMPSLPVIAKQFVDDLI